MAIYSNCQHRVRVKYANFRYRTGGWQQLQYGSDHDLSKGDGAEMHDTFPFECRLQINIDEDFSKSEYIMLDFDVDTSDWYE